MDANYTSLVPSLSFIPLIYFMCDFGGGSKVTRKINEQKEGGTGNELNYTPFYSHHSLSHDFLHSCVFVLSHTVVNAGNIIAILMMICVRPLRRL